MQKIMASLFFMTTMAASSLFCAEDNFNVPESWKEREREVNAFVRQELKNGTGTDTIRIVVHSEFKHKSPEYIEYERLDENRERLREEWLQCKNTPRGATAKQAYDDAIKAVKAADLMYSKTPEAQAWWKLWYYEHNESWIKDYEKKLQKTENDIQQKIGMIEQNNQVIRDSFTAFPQSIVKNIHDLFLSFQRSTTNMEYNLQQRERAVNGFVCQKLAEGVPFKTVGQEVEELFCKQIPDHHAIGLLDREKLRLRNALEPCWEKREWNYFGKMEYCYALEKEYEQHKDKLRQARKERNDTPEMQAAEKLSEHCANEAKIKKLKQKLENQREEIKKDMQKYEQKNQAMFKEVV